MEKAVSKIPEFRQYYLSEFEFFDGDEFITFNIVGINVTKNTVAIAVSLGTALGFFMAGFPFVVVLRALTHVIWAYLGAQYAKKNPQIFEKPLKTFEQVNKSVGEYVYAKFKNPKNGLHEVEGYLKSVNGQELEFEYLVKNIKKRIIIDYDNIKFIRLAVKF